MYNTSFYLNCFNVLQFVKLGLGFVKLEIKNDISLLELNRSMIFNDYVQPVSIPSQGANIPVNTTCVTTGFLEGKVLNIKAYFF